MPPGVFSGILFIVHSKGIVLVLDDAENSCRQVLQHKEMAFSFVADDLCLHCRAVDSQPDIIVIRHKAQETDALDICRHLRIDPDLKDIPVVVLGDENNRDFRLRAMACGVDYLFAPPFDSGEIVGRLESMLRNNRFRTMQELRARLQRAVAGLQFMDHQPMEQESGRPQFGSGGGAEDGPDVRKGRLRSLAARGSKVQFIVGVALCSIMPALALLFVLSTLRGLPPEHPLAISPLPLMIWTVVVMTLGFVLLSKYPRNIVRMRRYLEKLAEGKLPPELDLAKDEDDLRTIEVCLQMILRHTRESIETIKRQQEALRTVERQQVMIESLGTACHHLGQPTTVISVLMHLIKKQEMTPQLEELVAQGLDASAELSDLLKRLQSVTHYRTESYVTSGESSTDQPAGFILDMPD